MAQLMELKATGLSIDERMQTFLVNNFNDYFEFILKEGEKFKGLEGVVKHIKDNPEALRRIDYGRFLERMKTVSSEPDFAVNCSYLDSLVLLMDLQATYLTMAKDSGVMKPTPVGTYLYVPRRYRSVSEAFHEHRLSSLPKQDQMILKLFSFDFLSYLNLKLNMNGLEIRDLENIFLPPKKEETLNRLARSDYDRDTNSLKSWFEDYPYNTEVDKKSLEQLKQRLQAEPHQKDPLGRHRSRLIKGYNRVLSDYEKYKDDRTARIVDKELGIVRRFLKENEDSLKAAVSGQLTESGGYAKAYIGSQLLTTALLRSYVNYLNKWQPKQGEKGALSLLEGYEGHPIKANQFEEIRFLTMYFLSKLTMQMQEASRREYEISKGKNCAWIKNKDIIPIKPEDLTAYGLFYTLRKASIESMAKNN